MKSHYISVIFIVGFIIITKALSPPLPPVDIRIESTGREFLVRWKPPLISYGEILKYLINYNVLPDLKVYTNVVNANQTFSLIPFGEEIGQLFLISLQAQNDYGLSKQSEPRYIRAGCGNEFYIEPQSRQRVVSPLYPSEFHQGVLCIWHFVTNDTHGFKVHINDIGLGPNNPNCASNYVSIDAGALQRKICSKEDDIVSESSEMKILFKSGTSSVGKGVSLDVFTVVKKPDPPDNITLSPLGKVILVTWGPSKGNHLSISSYKVCYQPLPSTSKICLVVLAKPTNQLIINTQGHEGQVFSVTMTSRIDDVESESSTNKYYRAPCSTTIILNPGETANITSPAYPRDYPPGVICHWSIRTSDQTPLHLRLLWYDVQYTTACNSDYIKFTLTNVQRICGSSQTPRTMMFNSGTAEITFVSDESVHGRGFLLVAAGSYVTAVEESTTTSRTQAITTTSKRIQAITTISVTQTTSTQPQTSLFPLSKSNPSSSTEFNISFSQASALNESIITSTPSNMQPSLTFSSTNSQIPSTLSSSNTQTPSTIVSLNTQTSSTFSSPNRQTSSLGSTHTTKDTTTTVTDYTTRTKLIKITGTRKTVTALPTATVYERNTFKSTPITPSSISEAPLPPTTYGTIFTDAWGQFVEPEIDINATHPLYLMIIFRFNTSDLFSLSNSSNIMEDITTQLKPYFNTSNVFHDLAIDKQRVLPGIVPLQFRVGYRIINLLQTLKNTSFSLIKYVNTTTLSKLLTENITWAYNLVLDKGSLQKFVNSNNFVEQDIKNPCDLVKSLCKECHNSKSTRFGIVCTVQQLSATKTTFNPLDKQADQQILTKIQIIIIAGTSGVAAVICLIITVFICRRRMSRRVIVEGNNNNVPVHNFMKTRHSANVKLTGFSVPKYLKKTRKRGWSLPCRVVLEKQKSEYDLEQKVKKLGVFIDDKDTLKKRLRVKKKHRRGNSL